MSEAKSGKDIAASLPPRVSLRSTPGYTLCASLEIKQCLKSSSASNQALAQRSKYCNGLTLPAHAVHDIGMGRASKQETIQPPMRRGRMTAEPIEPRSTRTGKKSVTVYLSPEKWRELKIIAVLTDATLDKLLQAGADMVIGNFRRGRATTT